MSDKDASIYTGDSDDVTPASPEEAREIEYLRSLFAPTGDSSRLYQLLDGQLAVLHQRAISLVQVAGVIITVTGFSGRIIADTNFLAQLLVVAGLSLVVLAAAIAIGYVMPVRWITSYLHLGPDRWLAIAIRRRNRKTRAFWIASVVLLAGITLYLGAIAMMLLDPTAAELRRVR
jgi:hypothetical protein